MHLSMRRILFKTHLCAIVSYLFRAHYVFQDCYLRLTPSFCFQCCHLWHCRQLATSQLWLCHSRRWSCWECSRQSADWGSSRQRVVTWSWTIVSVLQLFLTLWSLTVSPGIRESMRSWCPFTFGSEFPSVTIGVRLSYFVYASLFDASTDYTTVPYAEQVPTSLLWFLFVIQTALSQ